MESKNNDSKSAVVFGGSGFLGSYVVAELVERGWRVRIADLNVPPEEWIILFGLPVVPDEYMMYKG